MREAKLVGLSPDGTKVILAVAETGEEVAVGIDDRLRAAVRGDRARLGQLEITMESALRPRDIQARIRSGESPESVAAVAQMPVDRVMAFAGPVLAERDHIASIAQRASVRRRGGDGASRNLGTWVTERLRSKQIDPNSAEWDAWRRDDGRWAIRVEYITRDDTKRTAMFAYDAPGRYAVPDDDEARWLVGEQPPVPAPTHQRRLAAVGDDFDVAPDHVADSYEAGFEQAVTITREETRSPDRRVVEHRDSRDRDSRDRDRREADYRDDYRDDYRESEYREPDRRETGRLEPDRRETDRRETDRREVDRREVDRREIDRRNGRPDPADRRPRVVPAPRENDDLFDEVPSPTRPAPSRPHAVPPHPDEEETVPIERPAASEKPVEPEPAPEEPKKRARRGQKKASVPSWDEIMFGKKAD